MSSSEIIQQRLNSRQTQALLAGILGLVIWLVFGFRDPQQFFRSYIFAFMFWAAVPLGCLGILLLHHLTGGWWGYPIRRVVEAGSRTLPIVFVLFLPLLWSLRITPEDHRLYLWAQPAVVAADPIVHFKSPYLNPTFFTIRAVIYFAIWILIATLLNRWSAEQDRTANPVLKSRMSSLSGPSMVIFVVVLTLAVVDWVMSLEPHWFSTMYGFIFLVTDALAGLSFSILVVRSLSDQEPLKDCLPPKRYIDLGNMMLAMVLLWAYLSFSELLIIWSGNLKNEIPWYKERAFGGWASVGAVLLLFHFFVPFFLLLQRRVKRRLAVLSRVAALLFLVTILDLYWIIVPSYEVSAPHVHLQDLLGLIGLGGLWIAAFFWQYKKWPLLPLHDPRYEGVALEHSHGD
ncbi:MAG TPA: hypothetical protein VHX36_16795 [Candidatus Acidoferrales bacterium]|jgi:hypothetical protein|nr:hypothetical protein [Candidatus Acidoferrales bacterium]